jgi:deazaflavin-dependent oxidoreductase (nitroreductase family)
VPNIRWLIALITVLHRFVYQKTGGWIGGWLPGQRFLLLSTIGRRTGEVRTQPLLYVRDGKRFVVVGSNGGDDRAPAWWLNLQACPRRACRRGARCAPCARGRRRASSATRCGCCSSVRTGIIRITAAGRRARFRW